MQGAPAQGRPAHAFLERMGQLPAVRAGMAVALGAGGLDALAAVFRRDVAAAADAQPRRPIPGARFLPGELMGVGYNAAKLPSRGAPSHCRHVMMFSDSDFGVFCFKSQTAAA